MLFDKDGTLANSEAFLSQLGQLRLRLLESTLPNATAIFSKVFGIEGDRVDPAGLLAVGSRQANIAAIVEQLIRSGMEQAAATAIVQSAFLKADQDLPRKAPETPLIPGCRELLHRFTDQGVRIGLLSSDVTANLHDFAAYYGLDPYLQVIVGADQGLVKPDPLLMKRTCQRLNVAVENTLMIGDAETDIRMARSAGAGGSVGVSWGWQSSICLPEADVIVHHPLEIQIVS